MDLYQPLYAPRPLVEPELFASLRPPSYSGAMDGLAQKPGAPAPMAAAPGMGGGPGGPGGMPADEARRGLGMDRTAGAAGFGGGAGFGPANGANRLRGEALAAQRKAAASFATSLGDKADLAAGVASAANAEKLGDAFQYVIEHPVNLPRQKSALLPIVGKEVEGERVSIYNPSVHAKFPLLGLRFKNTTGLPLMQGPVTVLDGSVYAGDARLPDLQANEDRLLAYAVDLGTEVQPVVEQPRQRLTSVKVHRGLIQTNSVIHEEHTYKLANRSDKDRTVLVEHPYRPEFKLVPEQKVETTREVYRFPVAVKSGQSTSLKVIEERDLGSAIAISNTDDNTIRMFINGSVATAKVKETLAEAIKRKEQVAQVSRELAHTRDLLKTVSEDQSRLRANLKETPPNTELSKRTQDKILKEDTEIDELNAKIKTLQEREYAERKSFEDYLVGLNVE
jgi:hypothetical protein